MDSSNDTSDPETSDDDLVLSSRPKSKTRLRHPPPERIHQLWQIYIENVDPLMKVVHVPTIRPAIQKAASNLRNIPRSFEALMFAIYGAAIMSLRDDGCCEQRFGEPRKTLLSRYISATKAALSRAEFTGTLSLVVLQALVLHLFSVRDIYEPRVVWSLTGVAVRIAQVIGLERDGETLGLPPFEAEMRRRVWWILKSHDFRAAGKPLAEKQCQCFLCPFCQTASTLVSRLLSPSEQTAQKTHWNLASGSLGLSCISLLALYQ